MDFQLKIQRGFVVCACLLGKEYWCAPIYKGILFQGVRSGPQISETADVGECLPTLWG